MDSFKKTGNEFEFEISCYSLMHRTTGTFSMEVCFVMRHLNNDCFRNARRPTQYFKQYSKTVRNGAGELRTHRVQSMTNLRQNSRLSWGTRQICGQFNSWKHSISILNYYFVAYVSNSISFLSAQHYYKKWCYIIFRFRILIIYYMVNTTSVVPLM